jgi:hypothetical protein
MIKLTLNFSTKEFLFALLFYTKILGILFTLFKISSLSKHAACTNSQFVFFL